MKGQEIVTTELSILWWVRVEQQCQHDKARKSNSTHFSHQNRMTYDWVCRSQRFQGAEASENVFFQRLYVVVAQVSVACAGGGSRPEMRQESELMLLFFGLGRTCFPTGLDSE